MNCIFARARGEIKSVDARSVFMRVTSRAMIPRLRFVLPLRRTSIRLGERRPHTAVWHFAYRESRSHTLTDGRHWRREYPVMVYPGPMPLATSAGTSAVGTEV